MIKPLAEVLRPQTLEDYIGQEHLIGEGAILHRAIKENNVPSMILWGPPGVGKTTLAGIIANTISAQFYTLSAINSGVKEVREVIDRAKLNNGNSILFVDEIHRFSKNQQDSLLGAVEKGVRCGMIIKEIASLVGGSGGGRPDSAQAGGKDASGMDEALSKAIEIVKNQVK